MRAWNQFFARAIPGLSIELARMQGITKLIHVGLAWMLYVPVGFVGIILMADAPARVRKRRPWDCDSGPRCEIFGGKLFMY